MVVAAPIVARLATNEFAQRFVVVALVPVAEPNPTEVKLALVLKMSEEVAAVKEA